MTFIGKLIFILPKPNLLHTIKCDKNIKIVVEIRKASLQHRKVIIKYGARHRIKRTVTMTQLNYTVSMKKCLLLGLMGAFFCQSSFALEALSDESLSQETGEGIALFADNFKMVFQKAEDNSTTSRTSDRTYDTGLIRIVPVGPLSSTATSSGAKKADAFLYGLAISKSDSDSNSRFSNTGLSWGGQTNPWVLTVNSTNTTTSPYTTYDFAGNKTAISYLGLDAPWALSTWGTTSATSSSNPIKLGLWGDIFARDQATAVTMNNATGAPSTTAGLSNRLRFQMVANGIVLDGSSLKLFETLNGATDSTYNNTLGLTGIIRLNTNITNLGSTTASDSQVLRLSTSVTANDGTTALSTPSITGEIAPTFNSKDGLFLYNPNINLVFGSLNQPLIFNVAADGTNFSLELTRIPNVASVYNQIYTDYNNDYPGTYSGSTCNVTSCGTASTVGGTTYQGSSATHSSIGIGSVSINNGLMRAVTDSTAIGVTMKDASGNATNLGSAVIDGMLIQHLKISTTGL